VSRRAILVMAETSAFENQSFELGVASERPLGRNRARCILGNRVHGKPSLPKSATNTTSFASPCFAASAPRASFASYTASDQSSAHAPPSATASRSTDQANIAAANDVCRLRVQATFCRRRHQPSKQPLAKIRPGSPAPRMGPGTGANNADEFAVMTACTKFSGMKKTNSATM